VVYDVLCGHFAEYLTLNAPISVRPGEFLVYRHIDARNNDCFGLAALIRKLHWAIASAWPDNNLVPYGYSGMVCPISINCEHTSNLSGQTSMPSKGTADAKGKRKAQDTDSDVEYLGTYNSRRKTKCQKGAVKEDGIIDLCSD
jgi:hypothetical protein